MGMHFGILAVPATLADFHAAFRETWPTHEPARTRTGFANWQELWDWAQANEKFVSANDWSPDNPGSEVCFFYQDGPWAVMVDPGYALCSGSKALKSLSARFGKALCVVIETAGGTAFFEYHEKGVARRVVRYVDGDMHTQGARLPEEMGMVEDTFYMDQVEEILRAFGLSQVGDESVAPRIEAIEIVDRTDYRKSSAKAKEDIGEKMAAVQEQEARAEKPWWRLW
jgi:hypothetical protein